MGVLYEFDQELISEKNVLKICKNIYMKYKIFREHSILSTSLM